MFESQGTTPESAQDSTESVEAIVSAITPEAMLQADITILEAKIATLESNLAWANSRVESAQSNSVNYLGTIISARQAIQEVLAGDVDAQQTFEDFRTAFELLGVTLDREVEIEISVTWRGTITLPTGVDPEDLDIDDFGISIGDHAEYETEGFGYGMHDYGIREI